MPPRDSTGRPLDPTADAAGLLRRVGFVTLALALPVASVISRRAGVVLAPVGIMLLVAAAVLEAPGSFARHLLGIARSRAGLFLAGLLLWIALTAAWSPYRDTGWDKALNIAFAAIGGMLGAAALPSRMRASNLNLIALGVGAAAVFAMLVSLQQFAVARVQDMDMQASLTRGFAVLAILVWPAVAWLLSRERLIGALALAGCAGVVAMTRIGQGGAAVIFAGALIFGAMTARPALTSRVVKIALAALFLLAPLAPFLLAAPVQALGGTAIAASLNAWADIIMAFPVKLITGHGLDSVLRGKFAQLLPVAAPSNVAFEVWHELGAVGAVAAAGALWFAVDAASRMPGPLAAGGVAAYVTAVVLAMAGVGVMQSWWLFTLAVAGILFAAIARGQFRTERPQASAVFDRRAGEDRRSVPRQPD